MLFLIMWCIGFYSAIIAVYFSANVNSDFLPIKWNVSTDVGHSHIERLYEYPMFTDVAPAACDLTENICDPGCCADPDCDEEQRKSFNCVEERNPCSRPFSHFDCNCNSERPYWFPVLCYVFENPIYLGAFHKTLGKIENLKDFVAQTNGVKYKFQPTETAQEKQFYVFGSHVLAYLSQNGSHTPYPHPLFHDNSIYSGLSHDCYVPVKYLKNQETSCYVMVTKESCENDLSLGAQFYLLKNDNSTDMQEIPVLLKNLLTQEKADVSVIFKYSSSDYFIRKFKGNLFKYFYSNDNFYDFDLGYDKILFNTFWSNSICHNIVNRAVFNLITNASEIQKVEIKLYLTNASVSNQHETVYVKKVHNVTFVDVNTRSESEGDNYFYNRGYYIGESLNFGYIRKNESQINWEKGQLKIYFNGGLCNRSRDVSFGYNTYSVCSHPIRSSNCSRVREEITLKMEYLTRGEFLAPYGNYRNPQRAAVPLLRNFNSTEWNSNGTDCLIPIKQDVYIQYVTGATAKGFYVYEAVGAMINRSFANITNEDAVSLVFGVVFLDVTSSGKKPLSRFWEKIYSPEESENAWLNIFNVFDRPVSDQELEESTFWFILPVVLCGTVILLRDFR